MDNIKMDLGETGWGGVGINWSGSEERELL
jgi:hypothetical protein